MTRAEGDILGNLAADVERPVEKLDANGPTAARVKAQNNQ
jgi:hypothetical protein